MAAMMFSLWVVTHAVVLSGTTVTSRGRRVDEEFFLK
jgi:hypothetical protein